MVNNEENAPLSSRVPHKRFRTSKEVLFPTCIATVWNSHILSIYTHTRMCVYCLQDDFDLGCHKLCQSFQKMSNITYFLLGGVFFS